MAYTKEDAKREVGDSMDWAVGLEASIKKWEQRARGDILVYRRCEPCGLCFVRDNRNLAGCHDCRARVQSICLKASFRSAKETLQMLIDLRKEVNKMDDCSKTCANFKAKEPKPPFPNTLRTADLVKGMLVENKHGDRYVTLRVLGDGLRLQLFFFKRGIAREVTRRLCELGCQPYPDGHWSQSGWLQEVK